jgi:hypothetical protein
MSEIEGKAARVAASECGQRASFNRANGMSEIEGKAARVAASECGQRASFNRANGYLHRFTLWKLSLDYAASFT